MSNDELLRLAQGTGGADRVTVVYRLRLARWYAENHGLSIDRGCWIKTPEGRVVCQGWCALYDRIKDKIAEDVDRLQSAARKPLGITTPKGF